MLDATAPPFDPVELEPSLRPFGQSRMLPRDAYVSPRVFAFEQERFFAGSWTCVGRESDLEGTGAQRAVKVGQAGALLTRGTDGRVRAFANTCRHRGHELLGVGQETTRRTVLCPYHAWTYDLDGSLRAAPGFREHTEFRPADPDRPLGARPLQVALAAGPGPGPGEEPLLLEGEDPLGGVGVPREHAALAERSQGRLEVDRVEGRGGGVQHGRTSGLLQLTLQSVYGGRGLRDQPPADTLRPWRGSRRMSAGRRSSGRPAVR